MRELQRSAKDVYLNIRIASPHCILPGGEPFSPQASPEATKGEGQAGVPRQDGGPSYKRSPRFEFRPGDTLVRSERPGKFRVWQSVVSLELFGLAGEAPGSSRSTARRSASDSRGGDGRSVSSSPPISMTIYGRITLDSTPSRRLSVSSSPISYSVLPYMDV
jgi:hypothetical protein